MLYVCSKFYVRAIVCRYKIKLKIIKKVQFHVHLMSQALKIFSEQLWCPENASFWLNVWFSHRKLFRNRLIEISKDIVLSGRENSFSGATENANFLQVYSCVIHGRPQCFNNSVVCYFVKLLPFGNLFQYRELPSQ